MEAVERVLSAEERSVLSAALERKLCLVSTDLRLRQIAQEIAVSGVWPQLLLQRSVALQELSASRYSNAVLRLLLGNRSFVTLSPYDLLTLCHQSTPWVRYGVSRLKAYLAHPNTDYASTFRMVEGFVRLAAGSGMRFGALAELLRHMVEGLLRHKDATELVLHGLADTIADLIRPQSAYPYPALVEHEQAMQQLQYEFLTGAIEDGVKWAAEEPRERPVELATYFVGLVPLLTLDRVKNNPDRES